MRKRRFFFIVTVALLAIVVAGYSGTLELHEAVPKPGTEENGYTRISAKEAKQIMDDNKTAIVVDVRTKEEYEERHIPGAILIPSTTIGSDGTRALSPDDTILLYCRSGNRSRQAAKKLAAAGYKKVFDFGGIGDWPYETAVGKS